MIKQYLSVISSFLVAGIVAVAACNELGGDVSSSCHWQEKAIDSMDSYLDANTEEETDKAMEETTSYLKLATDAKQREQREGFTLVCGRETLEASIQKMLEPVQ